MHVDVLSGCLIVGCGSPIPVLTGLSVSVCVDVWCRLCEREAEVQRKSHELMTTRAQLDSVEAERAQQTERFDQLKRNTNAIRHNAAVDVTIAAATMQ